jgi:hypothetical protein
MTKNETAREAATRLYAEHGADAFTMVAPTGPRALSQLGEEIFRYMAAVATWVALFEIRKAREIEGGELNRLVRNAAKN